MLYVSCVFWIYVSMMIFVNIGLIYIYIYILHNMFGIVLRKFLVLLISLKSTFKYQVKISAYVADEYVKVLVIK